MMKTKLETPRWKILAAWAVVSVPFFWGILKTVHAAMEIFRQ
jgi:hypothetical protein